MGHFFVSGSRVGLSRDWGARLLVWAPYPTTETWVTWHMAIHKWKKQQAPPCLLLQG
jgi:hypothetical protein